MVDVGQTVGLQTPLARLVDASQLKLRVKVSAAELSRIREGQKVTLVDPTTQAGETFQGEVARLGVAADQVTHTFPVEVVVPTRDGRPRPGQVVRATVFVAAHTNVLAVPEDAVILGKGAAEVFVAVGGKARRVKVTLGARAGESVIATGGLKDGDEVVVVGHQGLKSGDPIEVVRRGGVDGEEAKPPRAAPSKK
jgi:membrane fusion protein (multidrug efflux system)